MGIIENLGLRPMPWKAVCFKFDSIDHIKSWLSGAVDKTIEHGDSTGELFHAVYSGDSTEEDPIFTTITANGPTSEKHANLIAVAPEMLEALIEVSIKTIKGNYPVCLDCTSDNIKLIEKATGKTWKEIKELQNA